MNKENIDIGRKFKDAFQDYEIAPSANVWTGIQAGIKPGITIFGKRFSYPNIAIFFAISSLFVAGILVSNYFFTKSNQDVTKKEQVVSESFVQQTNPTLTNNSTNNTLTDSKPEEITNSQKSNAPNSNESSISENNSTSEFKPIIQNSTAEKISIPIVTNLEKEVNKPNIQTEQTSPIILAENTSTKPEKSNSSKEDVIVVSFSKDPIICFGEETTLEVSAGDYTYNWNNGSTSSKIKVKPLQNNEYTVTISNKSGKSVIHTFYVTIDNECTAVFVPSAFTPNGDGNNDIFKAEGIGIKDFHMQVMNKMGQIVFETKEISSGWDGSTGITNNQPTIYIYIIKYTDAKGNKQYQKGQVTLIR